MKKTILRILLAALASAALITAVGCSNQNVNSDAQDSQTASQASGLPISVPESQPSAPASTEESGTEKQESAASTPTSSVPAQSSAVVSTPGSDGDIKAQAVGDWTFDQNDMILNMSLKADGTAMITSNSAEGDTPGTWKVEKGQVIVTANNVDEIMELKDGKLYGVGEKSGICFTRGTTPISTVSKPESSQSSTVVSDDDDDSLEFGGHTDTKYVGDWKFYIDTSEFQEYSIDASQLQEYLDELDKSTISLKADGTVSAVFMDETSSGVWESNENIVNIIIEGSKQKFTYRDGILESDGVRLVKR